MESNSKNSENRISIATIITIICFIIICFPTNDGFGVLNVILKIFQVGSMGWAFVVFISNKMYSLKNLWVILIMLPWFVVCTVVNNGTVISCLVMTSRMFAVSVLTEGLVKDKGKEAIILIARVWAIFMLLQLLSMITHCLGYTVTRNNNMLYNYFFGIRVEINQYIIYAFAFNCIAARIGTKRERVWAFVAIISGFSFVFTEFVSTSILGCIIFILVWLISKFIKSEHIWKIGIVVAMGFACTFAFVQQTDAFRWLIVDILHENITLHGRTMLWEQAIDNLEGWHYIFGFGYSPDYNLVTYTGLVVNHPHNQYLQFIYNYGIIGFLMYINLLYRQVKIVGTISDYKIKTIYVSTIIATFVVCIASRNFWYMTAQIFYILATHLNEIDISQGYEKRKKLAREIKIKWR